MKTTPKLPRVACLATALLCTLISTPIFAAEMDTIFGLKLGQLLPPKIVPEDFLPFVATNYCVIPPSPAIIFDTYAVELDAFGRITRISGWRSALSAATAQSIFDEFSASAIKLYGRQFRTRRDDDSDSATWHSKNAALMLLKTKPPGGYFVSISLSPLPSPRSTVP